MLHNCCASTGIHQDPNTFFEHLQPMRTSHAMSRGSTATAHPGPAPSELDILRTNPGAQQQTELSTFQCAAIFTPCFYFPRFAAAAVAAAMAADVAAPVGLLAGFPPLPPVATLLPAAPRLVLPIIVLLGCSAAEVTGPGPPSFREAVTGGLAGDDAGDDAVCEGKGPEEGEELC